MVLAWVGDRLAVSMRQGEDEDNVLDKSNLIDLDILEEKSTRTTRANGLTVRNKMLKFSFKKAFSIQSAHLHSNIFAYCDGFWIKRSVCAKSFLSIGGSKLDNQFGLSFLKDKIWQKLGAKIYHSVGLNNPFIYPSVMCRVFLKYGSHLFFSLLIQISKMFFYPFEKLFIRIGNMKSTSKTGILVAIVFSRINSVDTNASFSVDNSGEIGQFQRIIDNFFIGNYGHKNIPNIVCRYCHSVS